MATRKRLTDQQITELADSIHRRGGAVTIAALQNAAGGGSHGRFKRIVAEWQARQTGEPPPPDTRRKRGRKPKSEQGLDPSQTTLDGRHEEPASTTVSGADTGGDDGNDSIFSAVTEIEPARSGRSTVRADADRKQRFEQARSANDRTGQRVEAGGTSGSVTEDDSTAAEQPDIGEDREIRLAAMASTSSDEEWEAAGKAISQTSGTPAGLRASAAGNITSDDELTGSVPAAVSSRSEPSSDKPHPARPRPVTSASTADDVGRKQLPESYSASDQNLLTEDRNKSSETDSDSVIETQGSTHGIDWRSNFSELQDEYNKLLRLMQEERASLQNEIARLNRLTDALIEEVRKRSRGL